MHVRRLPLDRFKAALAGARRPFVLDVRTPEAFALGRLPGSVNVPVHELGRRRRDLPGSLVERILVIGDDERRTVAGVRFLELAGFGDVALLEGGIGTWDGPLQCGPSGGADTENAPGTDGAQPS